MLTRGLVRDAKSAIPQSIRIGCNHARIRSQGGSSGRSMIWQGRAKSGVLATQTKAADRPHGSAARHGVTGSTGAKQIWRFQ